MRTSARDEILARIRTALATTAAVPVPRDYLRTSTVDGLVELFVDRLHEYGATVVATTAEGVADAVRIQAQGRVRVAPGPAQRLGGFDSDDGEVGDLDRVDTAVTACASACAQTGTIVLDGSADQGRRALTLVPDRHVCIVHRAQIVGTVPELVARLDATAPTTFISGPSATSDIELTRVAGVHGPRQLVVILVDEAADR